MALTIRTDRQMDDLLNGLKSKLNLKTQSGVIKKIIMEYQNLLKDNFNLTQSNRTKDSEICKFKEVLSLYLNNDNACKLIKNEMAKLLRK